MHGEATESLLPTVDSRYLCRSALNVCSRFLCVRYEKELLSWWLWNRACEFGEPAFAAPHTALDLRRTGYFGHPSYESLSDSPDVGYGRNLTDRNRQNRVRLQGSHFEASLDPPSASTIVWSVRVHRLKRRQLMSSPGSLCKPMMRKIISEVRAFHSS